MSKWGSVLVVVLSLLAGFGGGWVYNQFVAAKKPATVSTATTTSASPTAAAQSLSDCLKSVWGADKYAAIQANASLATTDDNLAALRCYKE